MSAAAEQVAELIARGPREESDGPAASDAGGEGQAQAVEVPAGEDQSTAMPAAPEAADALDAGEAPAADAAAEAAEETEPQPLTLAQLAERVELDEDELQGVMVTVGDEQVPLGEVLDRRLEATALDGRIDEFELQVTERDRQLHEKELDLHRARDETRTMLGLLQEAGLLTPEIQRAMNGAVQRREADQWAALTDAWPELRDGAEFARQRERLWMHVKKYGFSRAEFENVDDHRHMLVLRRLGDLEEKLANAEAELRERRSERPLTRQKRPARRAAAGDGRVTRPSGGGLSGQVADIINKSR